MRPRLAPWLALSLGLASCSPPPDSSPPLKGYVFQKGPYQALYGRNGKIVRLLHDEDGDGKPEAVTVFGSNGQPAWTEVDSDRDGVIDRWEYVARSGSTVEKVGAARREAGKPDVWEYAGDGDEVRRRDLDEDGDGRVDRIERFSRERLVRVEVDGDGDGLIDRWQDWSTGRLSAEELDLDADGFADRRLRYGTRGELIGMDRIAAPQVSARERRRLRAAAQMPGAAESRP